MNVLGSMGTERAAPRTLIYAKWTAPYTHTQVGTQAYIYSAQGNIQSTAKHRHADTALQTNTLRKRHNGQRLPPSTHMPASSGS